jgi:prepilin-type N-terminal cleavage/methylation domain-containing protein
MDCKTISINRRSAGFTLTEVMIASGITSLLLLVLAAFSSYSSLSFASLSNYSELEYQSRMTLDRMSQQIRQTRGLISFTEHNLVFKDADGTQLEFVYDPEQKRLSRVKDGQGTTLLEGCDYMRFDVFQRNPVEGTYDVYPTGSAKTCKLIQVSWISSRHLIGSRLNTETVQSAKIVIRKKS